jgi:hypothetical protein
MRADGERIRVAFAIVPQDDGSFLATLKPVPEADSRQTRVYTLGDVLGRWRAAERALETVMIDSPDYATIRAEVEDLRAQYQRLFDTRKQAS